MSRRVKWGVNEVKSEIMNEKGFLLANDNVRRLECWNKR